MFLSITHVALARRRALLTSAAIVAVCAACVDAAEGPSDAATAGVRDAVDVVDAADVTDAEDTADTADAATAIPAVDLVALRWLLDARAAAAAAATMPWPAEAVWPGFALHQTPTYLVVLSGKGDPQRGYLVGSASPPTGAEAISIPDRAVNPSDALHRYDGAFKGLWNGLVSVADWSVAGESTLLISYSAERDAARADWLAALAVAAMTRVRELEPGWEAVVACGQVEYPRFEDVIALLLLECAVLHEALDAVEAAARAELLRDWLAVRAAQIAITNLIGQRVRHYDNTYGSEIFAALRLRAAHAGVAGADDAALDAAGVTSAHQAALALPFAVSPAHFDDHMTDNGVLGAASIELAARAGLDVEPAYRGADIAYKVLLDHLGAAELSRLDAIKARHPWAAYKAREAEIMALPKRGGPTPFP